MRYVIVCLALLLSVPATAEIYLVARNKIEGTDLTGVTFLSSKQMPTLESCAAEQKAARTTGFQIFSRIYYKTHKGFSAQMQLYCAESAQVMSVFQAQSLANYTYLVTIENNRVNVQPFDNLGHCTSKAGNNNQTSSTRFCAKSQQALREP